jgi:hypothetical protein
MAPVQTEVQDGLMDAQIMQDDNTGALPADIDNFSMKVDIVSDVVDWHATQLKGLPVDG